MLEKVTLANNVCTSLVENHHTVECFRIIDLSLASRVFIPAYKLKFACLKPAHVQKKPVIFPDIWLFLRTSCTLTFHREGTRSTEGKSDHVFLRTNARLCVFGRICHFFYYYWDCFICTTFPDFFFFFTHNANWLKCCCKSLTHIRHLQPGSMFSASIVVQFLIFSYGLSPVVSVFFFLFLRSDGSPFSPPGWIFCC